jgi:MtN3 and saliva related transmembrane protein
MFEFAPFVGGMVMLSYVPQVQKGWPRGSTGDLSLGMLASLTLGLAHWIV